MTKILCTFSTHFGCYFHLLVWMTCITGEKKRSNFNWKLKHFMLSQQLTNQFHMHSHQKSTKTEVFWSLSKTDSERERKQKRRRSNTASLSCIYFHDAPQAFQCVCAPNWFKFHFNLLLFFFRRKINGRKNQHHFNFFCFITSGKKKTNIITYGSVLLILRWK